jgi:serine/threonine-protein kinase
MARVWAARQRGQYGVQKLVAIKTILPHLAMDPEFERMFLDEARIACGVHHPNVCEIFELGDENRTLYLAMEWVNGDSFSRVLRASGKTEPIEPRVAARVVADACAGAHAAHELTDEDGRPLGVVHRDLSPHNVLVTLDGVVKVCDFGVAKALGQLHETTTAGQLKGKVGYMSPEQLTSSSLDRRSDVFSLGCVLYESTTGVRPFVGDGEHEVMTAVVAGVFKPPSSLLRNYPHELERIVVRALAHEPLHRYSTTELMRFALEEFLAKGPLVTHSHVAQVVRGRLGEALDRRKEAIRQASVAVEQRDGGAEGETPPMTPPPPAPGAIPRPATLQMQAVVAPPPHASAAAAVGSLDSIEGTVILPSAGLAFRPPPGVGSPIGPESDRTLRHGSPIVPQSSGAVPTLARPPLGQPPFNGPIPTPPSSAPAPVAPLVAPSPLSPVTPPSSHPRPEWGGDWGRPAAPLPITTPDSGSLVGALPMQSQAFVGRAGYKPSSGIGHYAIASLLGLLAALVLGGIGLAVWLARDDRTTLPVSVAAATPSGSAAPGPGENAGAGVAATPSASASPTIVVRMTPPEGALIVDGNELPAEQRELPRPPVGQTATVVARASGYDDATLLVDYFTVTPLEIVLRTRTEVDAGPVAKKASRPRASGAPNVPSELPNNPY